MTDTLYRCTETQLLEIILSWKTQVMKTYPFNLRVIFDLFRCLEKPTTFTLKEKKQKKME